MIVRFILAKLLGQLFGEGFAADLAGRGVVFLADGARSAVRRDEERVTRTSLRPGETYTVIARPRPTRRERKLAAATRGVEQRYRRATRPNRKQLRAAKQLSSAQRRLVRAREGTRRHARLERRERVRGLRFDRAMRPTRRQQRLAGALTQLSTQLEHERELNLGRARRADRGIRRRQRVHVYD